MAWSRSSMAPVEVTEIAVDHREIGEDIGVTGRDLERFFVPIASIRPPAGVKVDIAHRSHQPGVVGVGGQQPFELRYLLAKTLGVGARGAVDGRMSLGQLFTLLGGGLRAETQPDGLRRRHGLTFGQNVADDEAYYQTEDECEPGISVHAWNPPSSPDPAGPGTETITRKPGLLFFVDDPRSCPASLGRETAGQLGRLPVSLQPRVAASTDQTTVIDCRKSVLRIDPFEPHLAGDEGAAERAAEPAGKRIGSCHQGALLLKIRNSLLAGLDHKTPGTGERGLGATDLQPPGAAPRVRSRRSWSGFRGSRSSAVALQTSPPATRSRLCGDRRRASAGSPRTRHRVEPEAAHPSAARGESRFRETPHASRQDLEPAWPKGPREP